MVIRLYHYLKIGNIFLCSHKRMPSRKGSFQSKPAKNSSQKKVSMTSEVEEDSRKSNSPENCNEENFKNCTTGVDGSSDRSGLKRRSAAKRTYSYSSSVYEEEKRKEKINGENRPDKPCHEASESPFSSSSGDQNFRGLLNWCVLMLVLTMGRSALENLMKYGILIDPINWYRIIVHSPNNFPLLWIAASLILFVGIAFLIEKMAADTSCHEDVILVLHCINLIAELALPVIIVLNYHPHPFLSAPLLSVCIVISLKLVSYVQINKLCRLKLRERQTKYRVTPSRTFDSLSRFVDNTGTGSKAYSLADSSQYKKKGRDCLSAKNRNAVDDHDLCVSKKTDGVLDPKRYMVNEERVQYPDNLVVKDFCYFLFAPTICYELNFPRTTRIRKRFLINRILETLFLWGLMLSLIQQWIYPTVENSVELFQQMNYPMMVDRILKLAIPNHLIWLMAFYWFFHSCCNLVAELMMFGDRTFYKDWWNAENIQQFWSMWNIPIHRFAHRHVYTPLRSKVSRTTASLAVFVISAFFHEYLCSIPLKMFRPWFFISFALQVPLVMMSNRITGKVGNIIMWMMLILGQPIALLMYFHDYYIAHRA